MTTPHGGAPYWRRDVNLTDPRQAHREAVRVAIQATEGADRRRRADNGALSEGKAA